MSCCQVLLSNYYGSYGPGCSVEGTAVCMFRSEKTVRAIKIYLSGDEHTDWMERESYYDSHEKKTKYRNVYYTGDNNVLYTEVTVHGSGDIGPGRHEFPFKIILPQNIPSSYDGSYGWIKYKIKLKVDRPWKTDFEDEVWFTVEVPINFYDLPAGLQNAEEWSDEKTICCFCCASGPVTMDLYLPKTAYVPGEVIKIRLNVENLSNATVAGVRFEVGMNITSKSTSPHSETKYEYDLLAVDRSSGVGAHGERIYEIELRLPESTNVPNFSLCSLFNAWTTLKVECEFDWHSNLEIEADLTLGHIPYGQPPAISDQRATNQQFQGYPPEMLGPSAPEPPQIGFVPPVNSSCPYPIANDPSMYPPYPPQNPSMAPPYPPLNPSMDSPYPPDTSQSIDIDFPEEEETMDMTDLKKDLPSYPASGYPPASMPSFGGYPATSQATAPSDDSKPSAPSESKSALGKVADGGSSSGGVPELPPPSYEEASKAPSK